MNDIPDKLEQLRSIAQQLRELFPGDHDIYTVVRANGSIEISIHHFSSYEAGTAWLRSWGVDKREKQVHDPDCPWSVAMGNPAPGIGLTAICDGLPPSCRIVKKIVKIPKTQIISETGEYVETEQSEIVCGQQEPQPASV